MRHQFKIISLITVGVNIPISVIGGCNNNNADPTPPQFNWREFKDWDFKSEGELKNFIDKTSLFNHDCIFKKFIPFNDYPLFETNFTPILDPWVYFSEQHHWYCYQIYHDEKSVSWGLIFYYLSNEA